MKVIIAFLLVVFFGSCSTCSTIKNILLIGRTGCGKSTLANVLTNKNNTFEEVFKEGEFSTAETRDIQVEEVEIDDTKYRIIDTVGIGDTKLTPQQVLNKLADAAHYAREGLNQILFMIDSRFTEEEINAYDLLVSVIFDKEAVKYTTIVRNRFFNFRNIKKCEEDIERMIRENNKLSEVVKSCNKVIHIDIPPTNVGDSEERNVNLNVEESKERNVNLNKRKASRTKLQTYLRTQLHRNYKPSNLDELNFRTGEFMTEKEKLKKQLDEMKDCNKKEKDGMLRRIEELKENIFQQSQVVMRNRRRSSGPFRSIGSMLDKLLGIRDEL